MKFTKYWEIADYMIQEITNRKDIYLTAKYIELVETIYGYNLSEKSQELSELVLPRIKK